MRTHVPTSTYAERPSSTVDCRVLETLGWRREAKREAGSGKPEAGAGCRKPETKSKAKAALLPVRNLQCSDHLAPIAASIPGKAAFILLGVPTVIDPGSQGAHQGARAEQGIGGSGGGPSPAARVRIGLAVRANCLSWRRRAAIRSLPATVSRTRCAI